MAFFDGKTIKNIEKIKGVLYIHFDDGTIGFIDLYLSHNLSDECKKEIGRSLSNDETYLFAGLCAN